MGSLGFFENLLENKLMSLHTAYLAKVISVSGNTAKIQPLGMSKAYGENAQAQSVLTNVPIATNKFVDKTYSVVTGVTLETTKSNGYVASVTPKCTKTEITVPQKTPLSAGDIVVCVCCERDISQAKNGKNSVPTHGRHSMSDSVIVAVLQ